MPARRSYAAFLLLAAALSAAWLLWSGMYKPLLLGLGALSVGIVLVLVWRAEATERDSLSPRRWLRLPPYWLWLLKEVVVSSSKVARLVLSRRLRLELTTVEIRALPRSRIGQATLGNSITLTPGTVTLDVHEGWLLVHALTRADAEALLEGEMNRRVAHCFDNPGAEPQRASDGRSGRSTSSDQN